MHRLYQVIFTIQQIVHFENRSFKGRSIWGPFTFFPHSSPVIRSLSMIFVRFALDTVDGAILERNDEFWISLVTFIGFGNWSGVTFFLNDHILQLFLYSKFWNKEYLAPSWVSGPEGMFEASSGHFFVSLTIVGHYVRKIICRTQITLKCPSVWLHFFCSCHSLLEPLKDRSIIIPSFSMFHKTNFSKISEILKHAKIFLEWFTILLKTNDLKSENLIIYFKNYTEHRTKFSIFFFFCFFRSSFYTWSLYIWYIKFYSPEIYFWWK